MHQCMYPVVTYDASPCVPTLSETDATKYIHVRQDRETESDEVPPATVAQGVCRFFEKVVLSPSLRPGSVGSRRHILAG